MTHRLKQEKEFRYIEVGEGTPIIVLHGLMGGLSNFDSVTTYFGQVGIKLSFQNFQFTPCPFKNQR